MEMNTLSSTIGSVATGLVGLGAVAAVGYLAFTVMSDSGSPGGQPLPSIGGGGGTTVIRTGGGGGGDNTGTNPGDRYLGGIGGGSSGGDGSSGGSSGGDGSSGGSSGGDGSSGGEITTMPKSEFVSRNEDKLDGSTLFSGEVAYDMTGAEYSPAKLDALTEMVDTSNISFGSSGGTTTEPDREREMEREPGQEPDTRTMTRGTFVERYRSELPRDRFWTMQTKTDSAGQQYNPAKFEYLVSVVDTSDISFPPLSPVGTSPRQEVEVARQGNSTEPDNSMTYAYGG